MVKKILITISLIIITVFQINYISFAGSISNGNSCKTDDDCTPGSVCNPEKNLATNKPITICRNLVDLLTQRTTTNNSDASAVRNLPDVSLEGGMTLAIKAMLRSAMYLTIIAIVVAAMYYIISRGKDEDMTKAKDIILYLVIGMAIIAAAYGIVSGVAQFNVFG